MQLVIAEKPSVARNIAKVLHATNVKDGYLEGKEYLVSWCIGHLIELASADQYRYDWKAWKYETLPMIPENWKYQIKESTKGQFRVLKELLHRADVTEIICATDAGREGELIFRLVYNQAECKLPFKRLWISSMEEKAILEGFQQLKDGHEYDDLYYSAVARSEADWLGGMNGTRALTCKYNAQLSCGRVQTPTLAMIARREEEIRQFTPKEYYGVSVETQDVKWTWRDEKTKSFRTFSREKAEEIRRKTETASLEVTRIEEKTKKSMAPGLYDLTTLQREANQKYGFSAKETLNIMQRLYENHKVLTYPRTDCTYISDDMKGNVIRMVDCISAVPEYAQRAEKLIYQGLNLDSRVVNTAKLDGHDHHAILPEARSMGTAGLSEKERNIYGLVIDRLLSALDKPYRYKETNYVFECNGTAYKLKMESPVELGWKAYDREKKDKSDTDLGYTQGDTFSAEGIRVKEIEAQPPKHFTDATLLSVMSNIDNRIDDKSLKSAVSGKGLGTEATRAAIIEELIRSGYAERNCKNIVSTQFGKDFIASVPDSVKAVERTAKWEQVFTNIKENGVNADSFIREVKNFVSSVIELEKSPERNRVPVRNSRGLRRKPVGICPRCGKNIYEGKKNFYCESGIEKCGFSICKEDKFIKNAITAETAVRLLNGEIVKLKAVSKDGRLYDAEYCLEDTGRYVNLKRLPQERKSVGICPKCGKNIFEGRNNFYCEESRNGCNFTLWKEDRYNGITVTAANASDLLAGRKIYKTKKKLNGHEERKAYVMEVTDKYVNIRAAEDK